MDQFEYRAMPPPPAQRVDALYVWIAIYPDGSEGMLSGDFDVPGEGLRHMPLMSSKRHLAEQLRGLAEKIRQHAMDKGDMVRVVLRTFNAARPTGQVIGVIEGAGV